MEVYETFFFFFVLPLGFRFIKSRPSVILWILYAKYVEDQDSVDFAPKISFLCYLLLFCYYLCCYIFWRSGDVQEVNFSGFDAGASVLKGRMELLF